MRFVKRRGVKRGNGCYGRMERLDWFSDFRDVSLEIFFSFECFSMVFRGVGFSYVLIVFKFKVRKLEFVVRVFGLFLIGFFSLKGERSVEG